MRCNPDHPNALARTPTRAFGIIELLVAISILAILAGLLAPAVMSMGERGRMTKGLSNLRQVGIALLQYAADNHQQLPPARQAVPFNPEPDPQDINEWSWQMHLIPYIGSDFSVFTSPHAAVHHPPSARWSFFLGSHAAGKEQADNEGFDASTTPPVNLLRIPEPSKHIMGGECMHGMGASDSDKDDYNRNNPAFGSSRPSLQVHILFADGRIGRFTEFDPTTMAVTYEGITDPPYDGYE